MPKQRYGYEIKFADKIPTKNRIETLSIVKQTLINESGLNEDDLVMEAWRESGKYGEEDLNVMRIYAISSEPNHPTKSLTPKINTFDQGLSNMIECLKQTKDNINELSPNQLKCELIAAISGLEFLLKCLR